MGLQAFEAWLRFKSLPLRLTIAPPAPEAAPVVEQPIEYDEAGRRYAFRFPRREPAAYTIDRERIFEYVHKRRRVLNGSFIDGDFLWTTQQLLPDLQTHPDVTPID